MKINKTEKQLLSLISGIRKSGKKVTKEFILTVGKHHLKDELSILDSTFKSLFQKKFIKAEKLWDFYLVNYGGMGKMKKDG